MTEESSGESTKAVSTQLATLVPTFDPSKDDLEQYVQKIEMLADIWPAERLNELATRLVLNASGAAFQKLQLQKDEIMTNSKTGIQKLVSILGGQWGKVGLEKKYESVEKALFRCVQKNDESNDSFLARSDIYWTELLSKKTTLEEIRAYVVLRGSLLSQDDKKRVIIESDAAGSGQLDMLKVNQSVRMLGSGFFQAMTGQKTTRGKTYDATAMTVEDQDDADQPTFVTEELGEDEMLEALLQEGDEDAVFVSDYETAMTETIQDDPELAAALNTYADARRRLSERFKNRGFWPVSAGKGRGKGSKGKGKSYQKGARKSLQQRILESTCRICGRRGHWKAECPDRPHSAPSASGSTAPTMTVLPEASLIESTYDPLPMEFMQLPVISDTALDEEPSPHQGVATVNTVIFRGKTYQVSSEVKTSRENKQRSNMSYGEDMTVPSKLLRNECQPTDQVRTAMTFGCPNPSHKLATDECALFATHGTHGILDTGATKSVVGSDLIPEILRQLHPKIREQVRRCRCSVTFRFGNQGTLESEHALVLPIGNLGLKIAIVNGQTPLLLSNTLLRTLKAQINIEEQKLCSPALTQPVNLHLNSRGLFLVDLNELALKASAQIRTAETFTHFDTTPICNSKEKAAAMQSTLPNVHISNSTRTQNHEYDTDNHTTLNISAQYTQPIATTAAADDIAHETVSGSKSLDSSSASTCEVSHHDPRRAFCPCSAEDSGTKSSLRAGGVQGTVVRRAVQHRGHVREDSLRQEIPTCLASGTTLAPMGAEDVRRITEAGSPQVVPLCPSDVGARGEGPDSKDHHRQEQAQGHGQEQQSAARTRSASRDSSPSAGRRRGALGSRRFSPSSRRNDRCSAGKDAQPGECGDRDSDSSEASSVDAKTKSLSDVETDEVNFCTQQQQFRVKLQNLIRRYETELMVAQHRTTNNGQRIHLLEIFCGPNSELTRQTLQLRGSAMRCGLAQGDLSTAGGRQQLFEQIVKHQPKHIWVSPTCSPWCSWSVLNAGKSMSMFRHIQQQREDHLYQLAIGIVLFRHQTSAQRHLHWEQPRRSLMFKSPLLQEVINNTHAAEFDMCRVGELKDPVSQKLIQKSMTILTTSRYLYENLHGRVCTKNHEHQRLEGSVQVKNQQMQRTAYSENYPRKFARMIAKVIVNVRANSEKPTDYRRYDTAFAATVPKRKETEVDSNPRAAKYLKPAAKLITPDEMPVKRRRLNHKTSDEENFQQLSLDIMNQVSVLLPRVGRQEITDPTIKQKIQLLFDDKQIHRVVACKGTERTLIPPKDMVRGEAPYRRAIVQPRGTTDVRIEDQWEAWEDLAHRQLSRPSHASRVNITVFAANPSKEIVPAPPPELSRSSQSKTPEESVHVPAVASENQDDSESSPNSPDLQDDTTEHEKIDTQSQIHGPRFCALPPEERSLLVRVHKNLGHPSCQVLSQVLRQKGYPRAMIQALEDFKCSTCIAQQKPKIPRPATLKSETDFADKVSCDGVTWTNKDGQSFHFYHYLDHGTNYQVAIPAPSRVAEQAIEKFTIAWLSWAGPPNEMITDAGTEFTSESFGQCMQQNGIKLTVIPPDAHWQMGRTERHGDILQSMLSKYELDHPINSYYDLQIALAMCTAAKNACSLRHGFSPEILVFGKGLRVPASLSSDDDLPAHSVACSDHAHGIRFRQQLAMRETARKAFHEADNQMSLRRAMLRRSRPTRGEYIPGEWVMVWRLKENKRCWVGPAKIIQQDGPHQVFCLFQGTMIRAAPEHVRAVSAAEAQLIPENPEQPNSMLGPGTSCPTDPYTTNHTNNQQITTTMTPTIIPTVNGDPLNSPATNAIESRSQPESSQEQPDQEPAISGNEPEQIEKPAHEIPVPDSDMEDDALLCDFLMCQDIDDTSHLRDENNLAWRYELEVPIEDAKANMCEDQLEELIFLATNQKKARTEVKLSTLSESEQLEFEKAKTAEVDNWLKTGTVCRILRNQLSPEQILRCRWILTWKPIEDKGDQIKQGKVRKAKARLVVLGFLDPALETLPRDSPTMNRQSRMLILQLIASKQWDLFSFDVKAAFLQGSTQEGRTIAIEPTIELRKAMNLHESEVCKLAKSAYGLVDAPFLWFKELDKTLQKLSFVPSPFDPTVYVLHEPGHQTPAGIIGVHVDDGLCGGNKYFHEKLAQLESIFPFGSKKTKSFTFTGIDLHQHPNYSITLSQEKYISKIEPIHIDANRKHSLELAVNSDEKQALRALIGSLQYAAVNTRPDLSSRLSHLQSTINSATIQNLIDANRVLHEAKRHKDTTITVQPIPISKLRFLAFSDASFSSKKQPDSHTGMMIMTTHEQISNNVQSPVSPISWGCKKIQKVVVSTLSAEATSLNSTLDQLSWLRLYWAWILDANSNWKRPKDTLSKLPKTITTATYNQSDITVTDCKSLYDLVSRTAVPNCQEFRTQLLARSIKDLLAEGVDIRWVHSGAQLADALTKVMETSFLRQTLKHGSYVLHDEAKILKDRATARNRIKWLQNSTKEENS